MGSPSYLQSLTMGLLLLHCFSRVWLCATPHTAAHQAPLSLGFSRQEHWSGLPFPSPMHESEKWKWSRPVVSDSSRPHGLQPTRLFHPWDFPGKSTGVGCHLMGTKTKPTLEGCYEDLTTCQALRMVSISCECSINVSQSLLLFLDKLDAILCNSFPLLPLPPLLEKKEFVILWWQISSQTQLSIWNSFLRSKNLWHLPLQYKTVKKRKDEEAKNWNLQAKWL